MLTFVVKVLAGWVTEMRKEAQREAAAAQREAEENRKDMIMGAC